MKSTQFPSDCMIQDNKYYQWYQALMKKRMLHPCDPDIYSERHHAIPRCCGGKESSPIIKLTAREHFIAHLLLPKFVGNQKHQKKLVFALWGISNQSTSSQKRIIPNSHIYALAKEAYSRSISGDNHWMKDPQKRQALSEKCKGRKMSEETKAKLSKRFTGRPITWKDKIGAANKGKKRTPEMRKVQSEIGKKRVLSGEWKNPTKGKKRELHECPHCHKMADIANLTRWHLGRCKHRKQS